MHLKRSRIANLQHMQTCTFALDVPPMNVVFLTSNQLQLSSDHPGL